MWGKIGEFIPDTINVELSTKKPRLMNIFNGKKIKKISVSSQHVLCIDENDLLYAFGRGEEGQLGIGLNKNETTPVLVGISPNPFSSIPPFQQKKITHISCGYLHSLCRTDSFEVYSWGFGEKGRLGYGEDVSYQGYPRILKKLIRKKIIDIAAGKSHSIAISESGNVYCWGDNDFGACGYLNSTTGYSNTPKKVKFYDEYQKEKIVHVTHAACGNNHTIVSTKENECYSWGRGVEGQLGNGDIRNQVSPVLIPTLTGLNIVEISCGALHSCAVTDKGILYTWGQGKGQLGHTKVCDEWYPKKVNKLSSENEFVLQVACGWKHTAIITTNEQVKIEKEEEDINLDEELSEDEYEVESIVDKRRSEGTIEYLIKWKGYPSEQNTWETKDKLNCPELIEKFEENRKKKRKNLENSTNEENVKKKNKKQKKKKKFRN
jgi:alpha-tubulin suppressor-like RCC1 family protein